LAVSWSDGLVDVISSETGSPLQIFRQVTKFAEKNSADSSTSIMCIGWGLSLVDYTITKRKTAATVISASPIQGPYSVGKTDVNINALLDREPDIDAIGIPAELSNQLLQLDVTDVMPKLPVLSMPASTSFRGTQPSLAELFSSQALLDSALHKDSSRELYALNTLLLSNQEGAIRVIVYDSLSIGNISLPFAHPAQHIKHASHPLAHCYVLLSQYEVDPGQFKTVLLPISFRFLRFAGGNIHFIDSKTAQLELLVQYVGEALTAVEHHWKHAQDLPYRFQQSIRETLLEKEEPTLSQSLYQLAVTGHCSEILREWLTDQLTERVRYIMIA
jgi:Anaphase-promoting complex, cyclosome, subunit 4